MFVMKMKDIEIAKKELNNEITLALVKDGNVITSLKRGVAPMIDFISEGISLSGYSLADKVVGKAAAFLYELMRIKELYAVTISEPALSVLKRAGILRLYCRSLNQEMSCLSVKSTGFPR